jgi:hypothetical protein
MFDARKFRRIKAQECGRFAARAVNVDDRLFWSRLAEQWLSLRVGQKRQRSAGAFSVSFRVIDSLPRVEFWRSYDCFAAERAAIAFASRSAIPARPDFSISSCD